MKLKPGDQIAYVPTHAESDLRHPDVQFGFVTKDCGDGDYFCRYWLRGKPGSLRTVANSERTPGHLLVRKISVEQRLVVSLMRNLGYDV